MSARRSQWSRQGRSVQAAELALLDHLRHVRSSCSWCSSRRIEWTQVGEDLQRRAEHRSWAAASEWLDAVRDSLDVWDETVLSLDMWRCLDCDEYGVFGPTQGF